MKHPVTVSMLVITVIGFGAIALRRTPVEFMPPMDLPFLGAFVPYIGATPAQVEQEIAIPAEGEFRTIPGVRRLYTNSSGDGCFISLNFEWGTDMSRALADVRDRMERLRLVLPEGADRVFVRHFKLETIPVMSFGLSNTGDYDQFMDKIEREILPKLKRLSGVANVELMGYDPRSIMVDIDQQRMLSHGISLYELIMTLNTANVDAGVGQLYDGGKKHYVRAEGVMHGIQDYAQLRLSNGLRLQDVATGGYRSREPEFHFAIDGNREVMLMITKDSDANTAETCRLVEAEIDRLLAEPLLAGTEKHMFFNQGKVIESALGGLEKSAISGSALAVLVLLCFLRRMRPTLVVALSIPGSLVVAFVYMFATGMTLNLITMMAMIVAVGMVVDNSIVVIENIYRHQAMGKNSWDSARDGAGEVGLAIVASTATTIAVFLPVVYMNRGQMSIFTEQFAVPVTISLGASLIIALTVIPLAVSRFRTYSNSPMERLRRGFESSGGGPAKGAIAGIVRFSGLISPIRWMVSGYERSLRWSMSNRLASMLLVVGIVVLTVRVPMRNLPFRAIPDVDRRTVSVGVELDPNFDMAMADTLFNEIESMLNERREALGIKHIFKNYDVRGGEVQAFLIGDDDLSPGEEYPFTTDEAMDIVWHLLPERLPGARLTVSTGGEQRGAGSAQNRISLQLLGEDADTLDGYADRLIATLEALPGLTDVRKSSERAQQEYRLRIDNVLAERAGIDPLQVAQTVGFALMGTELSRVKQGGREISVWAQFQAEDRRSRSNLDNVMLRGASGAIVTLNQLVSAQKSHTPQSINRRDGKNFIYVTASVPPGDYARVNRMLADVMTKFEMPLGYSVGLGDELQNLQEDRQNFFAVLLLSVALIYIVMASLFESLLLPLSILTTVPLAFLGVVWTIYLASVTGGGVAMDTVAFIGCILMVGVIVNNGIVIVDHIAQLRREGVPRFEAILQGGEHRLRPVLMTALTTILGALPLAAPLVFPHVGNPATVSLGCTIIGGLAMGTLLTLYVVPLFYTFIDDLQNWLARFFASLAGLLGRRTIPSASQ